MEDANGRAVVVGIDESESTVTLMLPRYTAEELAARNAELAARAAGDAPAPVATPPPAAAEPKTPETISLAVSGQTEEAYTVVATASAGLDITQLVIAMTQPEGQEVFQLEVSIGDVSTKANVRTGRGL